MEEIIQQLFNDAKDEYGKDQKLSDVVLKKLWIVFQTPLIGALDLVDKRRVTKAVSPSGRSLYRVMGDSGTSYTCFETGGFCTCPAFFYSILRKGEHLMCKHALASKLAETLDLCKDTSWTDYQMSTTLESL